MHTSIAVPSVLASAVPSHWLYGVGSVLIGGAVLPFLLSVLLDALVLGIQRRRWRLLVGLLVAVAATDGALSWTLALTRAGRSTYEIDWSQLVALLFSVGMVVALWHGIPRVLRSGIRRRREDRERAARAAVDRLPAVADPAPAQPEAVPVPVPVAAPTVVVPSSATEALVLEG